VEQQSLSSALLRRNQDIEPALQQEKWEQDF
jgi:hypothetical protein